MSYDQHPWEREDADIRKAFTEKDAEIERLKGKIDVRDAVIAKLSGTVAEWRPLIVRAAFALEDWNIVSIKSIHLKLINDLREATKE